jgi:PAS domain-containing protein
MEGITRQIKESRSVEPALNPAYQNLPFAPDDRSSASTQYSALVARATRDAVRDWDVKSGALAWPQGLADLLGYSPAAATNLIAFWRQNLHVDDRARTVAGIQAAFASETDHWSGEYRLRRADGSYVLVLERARLFCAMRRAATRHQSRGCAS